MKNKWLKILNLSLINKRKNVMSLTYQELIDFLAKKDIEANFNVQKNPDFDLNNNFVPLKLIANLQQNGLITSEEAEMLKTKMNSETVLNQKSDCGFSTFTKQGNLCGEIDSGETFTYPNEEHTLNIPKNEQKQETETVDKNNNVELTNALLGVLGKVLPGKVGAAVVVADLLKNGDLKEELKKGKDELNKLLNNDLANKVKNLDILNDENIKEKLKQGEDFLGGLFGTVKEKASSISSSSLKDIFSTQTSSKDTTSSTNLGQNEVVNKMFEKQKLNKIQEENFLLLKEIKMSLIDILNNPDIHWLVTEKLDGDFLQTYLLRSDHKISFYLNQHYFNKTVSSIVVEKRIKNDSTNNLTLKFKNEDLTEEQKSNFETLKFHLLNKIDFLKKKENKEKEEQLKEKAKLFLDDL